MQPNLITLPVDVLNNGTLVNKDYTRFEESPGKAVYIGPGHLPQARNTMSLARILPKRAGDYLGVTKTSAKFTQDVTVLDAKGASITAPVIFEVSASVPIGTTAAMTKELRQRIIALYDMETVASIFNDRGEV